MGITSFDIFMYITLFVFGAIFGSFYNALIYRLPRDISIAKGHSMCPQCKETIAGYDLVPLFSWLILRGKCRHCKAPIPFRYFAIELLTAIMFVLLYLKFDFGPSLLVYIIFVSMLIVLGFIDYDHMIIHIGGLIVFTVFIIGAIVWQYWVPVKLTSLSLMGPQILDHVWGLAVGFGAYLLIYLGARLYYKKEAFGFGDVLLMGSIGLTLGLRRTLVAALLSFIIAVLAIVVLRTFGKKLNLKEEIPFGPFICTASVVAVFFGENIVNWYLGFIK